jgi:hypothetical protein
MYSMGDSFCALRRSARLGLSTLVLIALLRNLARAQTAASGTTAASDPTLTPTPAPEPAPALDTAPAPATAERVGVPAPPAGITSLTTAPTLTPEPAPPPPLALDLPAQPNAAGRPTPFYRKDWFWGALGLAVLTTAVILVSIASSGTDTPTTTLGNMRAF